MYSFIYVLCIIVCLCVSCFLYTIFRQIYNTLETYTASPGSLFISNEYMFNILNNKQKILHISISLLSSIPCVPAQISVLFSAIIRSHKVWFYLEGIQWWCARVWCSLFDHLKDKQIKDSCVHGGIACVHCTDTDGYIPFVNISDSVDVALETLLHLNKVSTLSLF